MTMICICLLPKVSSTRNTEFCFPMENPTGVAKIQTETLQVENCY